MLPIINIQVSTVFNPKEKWHACKKKPYKGLLLRLFLFFSVHYYFFYI